MSSVIESYRLGLLSCIESIYWMKTRTFFDLLFAIPVFSSHTYFSLPGAATFFLLGRLINFEFKMCLLFQVLSLIADVNIKENVLKLLLSDSVYH
jgi:hypothetical protein